MGNPMSPLTWILAFDPVIWILEVAASCEALGYVDDLLTKVFGPGHLILCYLLLLAATKKAGLAVEDHSCVSATCSRGYEGARTLLRAFPTRLVPGNHDGFDISLGPVELYLEILVEGGVIQRDDIVSLRKNRCQRKTKHAVVPAHSQALWARALEGTPLAPAITAETRFLGAWLISRTRPHEDPQLNWTPTAMRIGKSLTWEKPIRSCQKRCGQSGTLPVTPSGWVERVLRVDSPLSGHKDPTRKS